MPVAEGNTRQSVTLSLELLSQLQAEAKERNVTISDLIVSYIRAARALYHQDARLNLILQKLDTLLEREPLVLGAEVAPSLPVATPTDLYGEPPPLPSPVPRTANPPSAQPGRRWWGWSRRTK